MNNDLISRSHFDDRVRLAVGPDADEEYSADFLDGVKVVLYMLSTEPAAPTDGDLVSRSWLLAEYDRQHDGPAGKARKLIEDAPAAPREMTARKLLLIEDRMCQEDEAAYREYVYLMFNGTLDETVAYAQKWAEEHPEERSEEGA